MLLLIGPAALPGTGTKGIAAFVPGSTAAAAVEAAALACVAP